MLLIVNKNDVGSKKYFHEVCMNVMLDKKGENYASKSSKLSKSQI